jgi:hypothetical protein
VSTQFQYLGARSTPFWGLAWAPKLNETFKDPPN